MFSTLRKHFHPEAFPLLIQRFPVETQGREPCSLVVGNLHVTVSDVSDKRSEARVSIVPGGYVAVSMMVLVTEQCLEPLVPRSWFFSDFSTRLLELIYFRCDADASSLSV